MMKKIITSLIVGAVLLSVGLAFVICTDKVEVPTAYRGKIASPAGLSDIMKPQRFRMWNPTGQKSLILVDVADHPVEITGMKVFIPEDELNITVDLRGMLSIRDGDEHINRIIDKVPLSRSDKTTRMITWESVYKTYGEPVLRSVTRTILTTNSIDTIMETRGAVSKAVWQSVSEELKDTPLELKRLDLADVQPPDIIVEAKEAAKEREVAIRKAEAQKEVALTEAQANLEVALKQQEIDLLEAETQLKVQQKLSEGISDAWITQRTLTILNNFSTNDSKTVVLPLEFLRHPELLATQAK